MFIHLSKRVKELAGDRLGLVISEIRREKKISQDDLAKKAGISITFLSLIENGRRFPSMTVFHQIVCGLGEKSPELLIKILEQPVDEDWEALKRVNQTGMIK